MSNFPISHKVINNVRVSVTYDQWADAPYEFYDMAGLHLFWSDDRNKKWVRGHCEQVLGDDDARKTYIEALQELVGKYVKDKDIIQWFKDGVDDMRVVYDRHKRRWALQYYHDTSWCKGWYDDIYFDNLAELTDFACDLVNRITDESFLEGALGEVKDAVFLFPTLTGYCQGDTTYCISFITLDHYKKTVESKPRKDWKAHAEELMKTEYHELECWIYGDVWEASFAVPDEFYSDQENFPDPDNDDHWNNIETDCHYGNFYTDDWEQAADWAYEAAEREFVELETA